MDQKLKPAIAVKGDGILNFLKSNDDYAETRSTNIWSTSKQSIGIQLEGAEFWLYNYIVNADIEEHLMEELVELYRTLNSYGESAINGTVTDIKILR